MKIKSYFAASVEAAISQAKQELGEKAMLMNSRKAMPESRHLGEYEVVFACTVVTDQKSDPKVRVDGFPVQSRRCERYFEHACQSCADAALLLTYRQ
jgi:flagellar biosynthesis GTPase FlhF